MSQARLLQLPAELRNWIYEYAHEESPVGRAFTSTNRTQPLFLGLAQSCRAIREEFRPVYMEHTVFIMRLLDAYTFVAAYVTPYGKASVGNMLINFDYGLSSIETNILPLLQLAQRCPRLSVRASCSHPTKRNGLNFLLDARTGGWFDGVSSLVRQITVKKRTSSIAIIWDMDCEDTKSQFFLPMDALPSIRRSWHETCFKWLLEEKGLVLSGLSVQFRPVWSSGKQSVK